MESLPRSITLRTPNRDLQLIEKQAVGLILARRSSEGHAECILDEQRLLFTIPVWGTVSYCLFLHNQFLSEQLPGGYYLVSNINMNKEEFLDFVRKIVERSSATMERWSQESKINMIKEV